MSFHVNEHRQSKQIVQAVKTSMQPPPNLKTKTSVTHLQPAPPPPTLSAPPTSRRRSPAPPAPNGPQPQAGGSSLYSSQSSSSRPMDLNSAASNYSNIGGSNDLSGLSSPRYRSRTPVSAAPPNSAGPSSPVASRRQPIPPQGSSPPSSATPLPRSDSSASGAGSSSYFRPERERPPRSLRGSPVPRTGSPAPAPPPPRSVNRPTSSMGRPQQQPIAVPQRQGMI